MNWKLLVAIILAPVAVVLSLALLEPLIILLVWVFK